ncbi:hypothetical protein BDV95DRAFT_589331 [Massariosphaeria phaeospora]|uniref:[histone H3]-trimethyl-L-lysine(9) demethylase n=1 Tax=Massariosphaeria phaeospora TaxID=100035 RepID=A0A7C8MKG7_9PLEO|nr:hypothetical protein BDV95DRAFT_589331 [Massariosphaeria phaeospora]
MEATVDVVSSVEATIDKHDEATSKPALTPPTSEDMGKREERMSSELSELDSDDDGEEIEPDHYFEGGKIPVFKPTMDQFRNFKRFIDKIDKYGMKSGIVKVVPPKEWRESLPDLSEAIKTVKVKNPITQEFAGQHGIYTQANIEKQRTYNLPEWRSLTDEPHHQPPAKRGERRKPAAEAPSRTRSRAQAAKNSDDASPAPRRGPGRPRRRAQKVEVRDDDDDDGADSVDVPPTPKSPGGEEKFSAKRIKVEEQDVPTPTKARGRQPKSDQPKSTASRRMNNRTAVSEFIDEKAFKNFDYHHPGLNEYTVERCKELEENYWKTINYGQPMYGADMPGSLFDDRTTSWNVAKLPNLLDVLGTKVPGVNTAYLYLGMWKATFAWHLEDVDLYSINYIHFGAPKQWYSISQEDARRFEAAMKSIWPNDAKNCSQFLRHKTYLISPHQLEKQFNIKVNRLVHYEGEFVITYPYGYHSGYNIGYNCAESVNFANESWLNYGRIAKKCECESDSVWVDVNEIERKLRGEPTPEYYEETDDEDEEDAADHLPSPPPSVAGKTKGKPGRKPAGNKRKRPTEESKEAPKAKKLKRIRIRLKVPGRGMPCILCPNDVEFDDLLPTDNGLKAHRICADYTPETYISTGSTETVCNVANIGKDRLELKCNYCRSKRGAVFQCSQKKCTRAFHATCAAAAGVQVDLGPMPTFDEEGTEYFYDGYDFRCRFHRPKKRNAKTVDIDTLEKDKYVLNYAKTLKPKDVVQFQYVGAELYQIYGALVIENRPGEAAMLVEVLPDGDRVEIEWKYLLALDPADSQRPKPSANAKPLPQHLKENDASLNITNRTDGVPEMGDSFHNPNSEQKWAEFNTAPEVTKRLAKIDFKKENCLWHYLGKTSTEARPQYTDDLGNPKHNPKSNFLDTVKPAPLPIPPIERRSYPASYPIKPAPIAVPPRTPMQTHIRPADRPYSYKPRESIMTFKSPVYAPDTRKNPNSPVAHQPNVVYDHRAQTPHYGYSQQGSPYQHHNYHNHTQRPMHPTQTYHHYNPQNYSTSGWKPQPTPPGPLLTGIDQYAQSNQVTQANRQLPPYPYYQGTSPTTSRQLPPFPYSQAHGPGPRPVYSPPSHQSHVTQAQLSSRGSAPISNLLSKPAETPKHPMYADPPSSSLVSTAQIPSSQTDYLTYVTQYPYLKNAFLRRSKTYVSPYSSNGGFSPEWLAKVNPALGSAVGTPGLTTSTPSLPGQLGPPVQGLGPNSSGSVAPRLPPPRPMPQFQSPDAFQREMAKAAPAPSGPLRWEQMLKQLATSTGSQSSPNITPSVGPAPLAPSRLPAPGYQMANSTTPPGHHPPPMQSYTPPLQHPTDPQRPIPSPLSDASKSPKRPEYSPISDNGKGPAGLPNLLPSLQPQPVNHHHPGETWRYM